MNSKHWSLAAALMMACSPADDHIAIAGTIEIRQVSIAPLVSGRLTRLVRDEGDTVRAGDTLALMTQPGLAERVTEARARHAAAVARVRDLEAGARPQELETARAARTAALADSVRAQNEFARVETLHADNSASASQLDQARNAADGATARVRQAREFLDLVAAGPRGNQLAAARREAEVFDALVGQLVAQQDELVLRSPADGIVLLRLAEAGEVLAAGMPVLIIGLTTQPWVRAYVGQEHIARVQLGAAVEVAVDGYPGVTFPGTVSEINPAAEFIPRAALTERERADLVYGIKVRIDDAQGRLKAGMPVDLVVTLAPRP
ncbi:MAG: efflux RND transporter periplasmic adaptor subunit [Gemmatimonadales bacterium]